MMFFTSCSSSPSTGKAEQLLQEQIISQSGGKITLVSFQKVNGVEGELLGVKTYQLFYKAEIKFTADGTWLSGAMGVSFNFTQQKDAPGSLDAMFSGLSGAMQVHSGNRAIIEGEMTAEKTENGWQFTAGDSRVTQQPK